jgi:hypothetical protein
MLIAEWVGPNEIRSIRTINKQIRKLIPVPPKDPRKLLLRDIFQSLRGLPDSLLQETFDSLAIPDINFIYKKMRSSYDPEVRRIQIFTFDYLENRKPRRFAIRKN